VFVIIIFLFFLLIGIKFNEKNIYAQLDGRNTCKDVLPISNIAASNSSRGFSASNAIDNSSITRWTNEGKGSWLQMDLGTVQNICSLDIRWYNGNISVYNFVLAKSVSN
jgi:hypothetical protein